MKLDGISLYVTQTLVIGIGDKVTNCDIGGAKNLGTCISIPQETVDSGDWKVEGNTISVGADKGKYQFIYRG